MQKAFILFICVFSITVNAAKKDVITIDSKGKIILNKKTIKKDDLEFNYKGILEVHVADNLTVKQIDRVLMIQAKDFYLVFEGGMKVKKIAFKDLKVFIGANDLFTDDVEEGESKKAPKKKKNTKKRSVDIYIQSDFYAVNGAKKSADQAAKLIQTLVSVDKKIQINVKLSLEAKMTQLKPLFEKLKGFKKSYNIMVLNRAHSK